MFHDGEPQLWRKHHGKAKGPVLERRRDKQGAIDQGRPQRTGQGSEARAIHEHLAAKGVTVAMANIYAVLAAGKKRRNGKRKKAAVVPAAPALPKDAISLQHLIAAKHLIVQLGGVKEAQQAIAAIAKIG